MQRCERSLGRATSQSGGGGGGGGEGGGGGCILLGHITIPLFPKSEYLQILQTFDT